MKQTVYKYIISATLEIDGVKKPVKKESFYNYDHCWQQIENEVRAAKKAGAKECNTHHLGSHRTPTLNPEYQF